MKILVTLALTILSFTLTAQEVSQLVGNWKFKQLYEQEGVGEAQMEMAKTFFGTMVLQLFDEAKYSASILGQSEHGTWALKESTIQLTASNGTEVAIEVVSVADSELVIKYGKSALVMAKASDAEIEKEAVEEITYETVSITLEQAAKKWYLVKRESMENPEKDNQKANELLAGAYMDLSKNLKYQVSIMGAKEKGKWRLSTDYQSIVMVKDKSVKTWNVLKVTDTELELIQGSSAKKWIFSTIEP